MSPSGDRGYVLAALLALAVFAGSFAWLHDGPLLVPPQGIESLRAADSL